MMIVEIKVFIVCTMVMTINAIIEFDNCRGIEPDVPQDPRLEPMRLRSSDNNAMTICTSCKDMSVVLCPVDYTWAQAFLQKGEYIVSAFDETLALTRMGNSEGAGVTMRPIQGGYHQRWNRTGSSLQSVNGLVLDLDPNQLPTKRYGAKLVISADSKNTVWKTESFSPHFLIQNIKSKLVLGIENKNGALGQYLVMAPLNREPTQLWEYTKGVLLNIFTKNTLDVVIDVARLNGKKPVSSEYPQLEDPANAQTTWSFNDDRTIIGGDVYALTESDPWVMVTPPNGSIAQKFVRIFV